ncbi:MAG: aminomethyl-transferring glycine dehydrogenase subunit GcvPA [Candidatus Bathyarchaeota archaeon]
MSEQTLDNRSHPYIPNSLMAAKREMLQEIDVEDIEELYSDVPEKFLLKKKLNLPLPLPEFGVRRHIETTLSKNRTCDDMAVFLGGGCWPHYVPAVVEEIVKRSELLTSYTPYQPEISQGMLQALFEYQSMICELTGMEIANCSMYGWASASGEAARMVTRLTRRKEILVPEIIHPERIATLETYVQPAGIVIRRLDYDKENGQINFEDLKNKISKETAAVYIENPSYFGFIETQVDEICSEAHEHGALLIVGVDPTSLGILRPPGDYGADIVVGEGQPLGNSMNFGGPSLGIFACREDQNFIRQMPGRIIGITTTVDSEQKGFCMALQTREQHIRREKATSNICTNEALCAVATAVYLALLGPKGLHELGETILCRSNYAIRLLSKIDVVETPVFQSSHFKEFTVNFDRCDFTVKEINEKLLKFKIHGGKDISKEFPDLGETALYCVTEMHTLDDINRLFAALKEILAARG